MKVIIIAGFLGSGKTSLLLQMVKSLSGSTKRTAVIENELGEFSVDGEYLRLEGLQVRQLFGGCVCCTLSSGLVETLEDLDRYYHPDTVILEATGAADPGDIVASLGICRLGIRGTRVITVVDARRYEMLMKMMTPLLTSQIRSADIAVISKTDLAEGGIAERIIQDIRKINARAHVHAVSLEKGADIHLIMEQAEC